jgi:hypothetical protein
MFLISLMLRVVRDIFVVRVQVQVDHLLAEAAVG